MPVKKIKQQHDQDTDHRFLRSDARRNLDSLLNAAMAVFETSGVNAPMKEIAGMAGVGVGTVYRHFPQRSDLIVAVLAQQIDACADAAKVFASEYSPSEALSTMDAALHRPCRKKTWLRRVRYIPVIQPIPGLAPYFFKRMEPALDALLANASSAKVIRAGVPAGDLLKAVVRLCHGPQGEEPAYARSMIQMLLKGMACGGEERQKAGAARKS